MFCPKCKSLMMPKKDGAKKVLECSCGYKEGAQEMTLRESEKSAPKLEVVEGSESVNVEIDAECPKCGNRRAEYWEVQTRSSDEPPTRFHKCTKCKHTWREYS